MSKIYIDDNKDLIVPDKVTIPFIEGDGVGREITTICQKIIETAIKISYKDKRSIEWLEVYAGEKAFKLYNSWLPSETIDIFREYLVGVKGPLTTPVGGGIRSLNVALRQELDLFACIRPVKWFKGLASPLKYPQKVNMVIFRENTEDIYAGIEWEANSEDAKKFYKFLHDEMKVTNIRFPETSAYGVKPVSMEGSTRLIRSAINYAIENQLPCVTLVHKGNIMKFTEGGFKRWGYQLAEDEFSDTTFTMNKYNEILSTDGLDSAKTALDTAKKSGKVIIDDCIADAFLQNTLLKPEDYSVIATLNLNGDYISDQLAAMVGGIGIAPGANINYHTGHAIFEATHGTAPDIVGKDIVNPSSMLLSLLMLMDYIGWSEITHLIQNVMQKSFEDGYATSDLAKFMDNGKPLSTTKFGEHIINLMGE